MWQPSWFRLGNLNPADKLSTWIRIQFIIHARNLQQKQKHPRNRRSYLEGKAALIVQSAPYEYPIFDVGCERHESLVFRQDPAQIWRFVRIRCETWIRFNYNLITVQCHYYAFYHRIEPSAIPIIFKTVWLTRCRILPWSHVRLCVWQMLRGCHCVILV